MKAPDLARDCRLRKGWSLREAAQRMGIHYTTLGRYERGDFPITLEAAKAMARLYGKSAVQFLPALKDI